MPQPSHRASMQQSDMTGLGLGLGPAFRVRASRISMFGLGLVLGLEIGCRVRVSE